MTKYDFFEVKKEVSKTEISKPIVVISEAKPIIKKPKTPKTPEDLKKLTMDQIRALLVFVCNESPKHDSTQTKEVLINKIVGRINASK